MATQGFRNAYVKPRKPFHFLSPLSLKVKKSPAFNVKLPRISKRKKMVGKAQIRMFMVAAAVIGCFMMAPVRAFDHIVGGRLGWATPPNVTYYDEWAAKPRVFGVGDKLVFPFRSGQYNIIQVGQKDYEGCSMDAVIKMIARGPAIIPLDNLGEYYFYDGVGKHCEHGQKLRVNVVNEQGTSGKHFSMDFDSHYGTESETAPALVPVNATETTPAASSATCIQNVGVVSGSLVFLLWLLI